MKKTLYPVLFILFLLGSKGFSQIVNPVIPPTPDTQSNVRKAAITSQLYNETLDELNTLYDLDREAPDTNNLKEVIARSREKIALQQREFSTMPEGLSIRYLHDLKADISSVLRNLDNSRRSIVAHFKSIARKRLLFNNAKGSIFEFLKQTDSSIAKIYNPEAAFLLRQIDEGLEFVNLRLGIFARFKDEIFEISNQANQLRSTVSRELSSREARLFRKELPPIWRSGPSHYSEGFIATSVKTIQRSWFTLKSYLAGSSINIVLFRLFVYLLFLVPIYLYYRKPLNAEKKYAPEADFDGNEFHYFDRIPITVSIIMGLALSSTIFVNAPHSFLELIFLVLVFTILVFTFKNYPSVDRYLIFWILAPFLVLYLLNFFITPTFLSRIIWSLCIFQLVPLFLFLKKLRQYKLRYESFVRFLIIFLMVHIPVGWLWIIIGRYTLGKSVVIAAYNLLILAIIFRIALASFLEYLGIIASLINKKFQSINVNYAQLVRAIQPILYFIIIVWLLASYLANLSLLEYSIQAMDNFLDQPRSIHNLDFNYKSILLFLASVYFAFLLSNILSATFDQTSGFTSEARKSKFGSYVILFRLLIISTGFILAVMLSGIPLNTFTIIFGALSLGIGFGLQNMVANIFSGLFIAFERPFVVGDLLEYGKDTGRVKEIGLRATRILTSEGADLIIPNGALLSNNIKNWTYSDNYRAVEIAIPVDHGEDPLKIQSIISSALKDQSGLIYKGNSTVVLSEITEKATIYKAIFFVENLINVTKIKGEMMNRIYGLFKENDIKLPQFDPKYLEERKM